MPHPRDEFYVVAAGTAHYRVEDVPSRSAPAERHHVGSVFYLLLVGLVATAIIGA